MFTSIFGKALLLLLLISIIALSVYAASTKCRYCGSYSYGRGCPYEPYRVHEHVDTEQRCEFCGSYSYGKGCPNSPSHTHRHGHGGNKCIWCGSMSNG